MVVSWMIYATLTGALLGAAALFAERMFRDRHVATRWVWCAAVGASLLLPPAALLLPQRTQPTTNAGVTEAFALDLAVEQSGNAVALPSASLVSLAEERLGRLWRAAPVRAALSRAEPFLLVGWGLGTLLLLGVLGTSLLRLRAARGTWTRAVIDDTPVLVSSEVGPAVLGVFRHRIVIPGWVLRRDGEARALILAHEREHVRARDPLTVMLATLPVLLLPWHLPLWWQLRRLRLAVELDCDQRVLRHASEAVRMRYGRLLLEVGQRKGSRLAFAAAFSEGHSLLGRRIEGLCERAPANPARRAVGLTLAGGVLLAAACLVPAPDTPVEAGAPEAAEALTQAPSSAGQMGEAVDGAALARQETSVAGAMTGPGQASPPSREPAFTPMTVRPTVQNLAEVRRAMEEQYPPALRDAGIGGRVVLWFLVSDDGRVEETRLETGSGHPLIDQAALRVAQLYRFSPALNRDERVRVWVTFPLVFESVDAAARQVARAARAPAPPTTATLAGLPGGPTFTPMTVRPAIQNEGEVRRVMDQQYPASLREAGTGGRVVVWFQIDENGRVESTRIETASGNALLDQAALRVASAYRFTPAYNRDQRVPAWITLPLVFDPAGSWTDQGRLGDASAFITTDAEALFYTAHAASALEWSLAR